VFVPARSWWLISDRGQAGVTKASVTIVFNNQDRTKSPVGFENTPQITVTRQVSFRAPNKEHPLNPNAESVQIAVGNISKYLLNGHKSTLQNLQTLFQSVQLNINNPNFLIMQGKITKVLNMKPAEILGMVEEAAGTRMAKKDKKVEEIESVSICIHRKVCGRADAGSCSERKSTPSLKSYGRRNGHTSNTRRRLRSLRG
jgi:structural maintenance of chromosome 2